MVGPKVELDISPDARILVSKGAILEIGVQEHHSVIPGRCSVKIKMEGKSDLIVKGRFSIGSDCTIYVADKASLQFNGGFMVGNNCINCGEKIQIGKDFMASWGVDIMDVDGHPIFFDPNEINPTNKTAPVIIGDHCWIGHHVIIFKGVIIKDGGIVGAGSVVTRDVPNDSIVAGNPIVIIKEKAYWK